MADNVQITEGSGTSIAADEVTRNAASEKQQIVKISLGAEGAFDTLVDSGQQSRANSLPVTLSSEDAAYLDQIEGYIDQIEGYVDGLETSNSAIQTSVQLLDDTILADDAAFTPGTTKVNMAGFQADETSTDSVDEGDAGAARMTLDRKQIVTARSRTGTLTNVSSSASNGTILASNTAREGATIFNDSTAILYLKFGTTASATSYTVQVAAGGYYEVPFGYTGIIDGIWASANGNARVTEIT
jgi:hypothetical protein